MTIMCTRIATLNAPLNTPLIASIRALRLDDPRGPETDHRQHDEDESHGISMF